MLRWLETKKKKKKDAVGSFTEFLFCVCVFFNNKLFKPTSQMKNTVLKLNDMGPICFCETIYLPSSMVKLAAVMMVSPQSAHKTTVITSV